MSNAIVRGRRLLRIFAVLAAPLLLAACAGDGEPAADSPDPATSSTGAAAPSAATAGTRNDVVFSAPAGDAHELFVSSLDDDVPTQLTFAGGEAAFPVWSPSGDRILFVAINGDSANVMVLDLASREASMVLADNGNPADWGPRGGRVLVTKGSDSGRGLYIVDVATGAEERIDTGSNDDAYARWARSGDIVTYESGRDGNPEIYVTNVESGATARLTDNDLLDEWPSVSRDGAWVAWASGTEDDKNLWVMRTDGTNRRQVTEDLLFGDAFPEWSPDGAEILLTVRQDDESVLALVDIASGEVTFVREGSGASWR